MLETTLILAALARSQASADRAVFCAYPSAAVCSQVTDWQESRLHHLGHEIRAAGNDLEREHLEAIQADLHQRWQIWLAVENAARYHRYSRYYLEQFQELTGPMFGSGWLPEPWGALRPID